jgi:hypothetical protein
MIHPFDQDRPSPIVDDGDDAGPMIALRLRFGSGHHFACGGQGDDFLVGELCRGTAGCNGGEPEGHTEHHTFAHLRPP